MKHRVPVFDGDGHVLETDEQLDKYYEGSWKGSRRLAGMTIFPSLDGWSRSVQIQEHDAGRKHWTSDAKVWGEALDKIGLDGSVLYPTIALAYGLMREMNFATATATAYNNWLEAEYTRLDKRLFGVGLMPIENPEGAIKEMRRCKKERKNFVAMLLPSVTASGMTYGHPSFWPLYEEAERLDMPLALHGAPSVGFGFDHFRPFVKVHTLEHPVPLMIQLTDMMFSGVFDDFPKLRVAFLEGGASWVPFMMDRLDYEYDTVQGMEIKKKVRHEPSWYMTETENFWVSCEMGERATKYVVDMMGSDRIMYASDFPHEPTEEALMADIPDFLDRTDLDDGTKRKILNDNAKRFYRIA
ncbi:MAG: amidohydrolase [Alphaproteobacteria bacterium]|nr:amidohydrolase [Alphaproteobacteria bacterium]